MVIYLECWDIVGERNTCAQLTIPIRIGLLIITCARRNAVVEGVHPSGINIHTDTSA